VRCDCIAAWRWMGATGWDSLLCDGVGSSLRRGAAIATYRYKEKFEKDGGYRFLRDKKSILIQAIGYGRRLTEEQVVAFNRHTNKYLDNVAGRSAEAPKYAQVLKRDDWPDVSTDPLYKYVSDATWEYIRQGSFQFGSAQFYRTTPNINTQDRREGASSFHLVSGDNQLTVTLISGFNCAIFCGTTYIEGPDHKLMLSRFGSKRLKIEPVSEFLTRVCKLTGAFRAHVFDVVYNDLKHYAAERPGIERFPSIAKEKGSQLTSSSLRQINKAFFTTFDEYGFMPSLFAKPARYAQERERRIIFEMTADLRRPTIVVKDKCLLDFVTLVDRA
jgi:hypothetical protein